jgi:serine/threonine protein kinase
MIAVDTPLPMAEIVAGKYRIERVVGMGAMGVVAAARHIELNELRAIKFMLPSAPVGPQWTERFLREARAAVRLKSQHVTKVHDVGRLESGAPYIVMEYLEGMDLRTYLCEHGPLPVDEAVLYIIQACDALAEAHAAGIVHRDLKPANLFLTRAAGGAPCIKVLDFGIAKLTNTTDEELTGTFTSLGTPSYMSPEQARSARSVDARSDVWSLGVVLYVMLTGQRPFAGRGYSETCASATADGTGSLPRLRPDVPSEIGAIVMRCLQNAPARRYQSAAELAAALAPFLPRHLQSIDVAGSLHALGGFCSAIDDPGRPEARSGSTTGESEEEKDTLTMHRPSAIDASWCSMTQLSPGVVATSEHGRHGLPPRSFAAAGGPQSQGLAAAAPAARGQPTHGGAGNVDEVDVDLRDTFVPHDQLAYAALAGTALTFEAGHATLQSAGSWVPATVPACRRRPVRAGHGLLSAVVFGIVFFGSIVGREEPGPAPGPSAPPVARPAPAVAPVPLAAPQSQTKRASISERLGMPPALP